MCIQNFTVAVSSSLAADQNAWQHPFKGVYSFKLVSHVNCIFFLRENTFKMTISVARWPSQHYKVTYTLGNVYNTVKIR